MDLLLATVLETDHGKLLCPLYVSSNKHGGSLNFPFCFFKISSIKHSVLSSKAEVCPSSPGVAKYTMGPFIEHIVVFRRYVLSKKDTHGNKTKEQKSPNEWACFVEEKVEVLKSLIRCSENHFSCSEKKKKKQNFILKDVFQELPL